MAHDKPQSVSQVRAILEGMRKPKRKTPRRKQTWTRKPKAEAPVYPVATEPVTVQLPLPELLNAYYQIIKIAGHGTLKVSARGKAYKAMVRELWTKVRLRFEGRLAMRVNVTWRTQRRGDIDAPMKCLLDALADAGAYGDDSQIKLLVVEEQGVEKPGWVTVTIGQKPGEVQGTLFDAEW